MEKTYYEIYLGWHFAKNEVAYKAAIDSAVDYAWKNNVDSVHIQAEYPDIVRDLGYEFSEVICSYGQPTVFVPPVKPSSGPGILSPKWNSIESLIILIFQSLS